MSYNISLRVYQRNPARGFFYIVEKTVFTKGIWSEVNDTHTLKMNGSGTSGVLRFFSEDTGELFTVAVGVHNYKRWCDIVGGITEIDTALVINGQYYNNGGRDWIREKQLAEYSGTSPVGTKVEVVFTVAEGNDLKANIIIG